ncbi:MAG: STAS domain-containing protein [Ruminococcus sp.]|nr:STAS domain-containing protein [Ruminococcus sp.]
MTINRKENNGAYIYEIEGRIDTLTAPELEADIKGVADKAESLLLDFAKVEYISSAGLRVLLFAHKAMSKKGGLKLVNVGEDIMEIFEVTGFSDILSIE